MVARDERKVLLSIDSRVHHDQKSKLFYEQ